MALVFKPKKSIFIPATGGHPKNAEYRVAWGTEQWKVAVNDSDEVSVSKVQMVYNGTVAGMLSPSFPDATLNEQSVVFALKLLKENKYGTNSKTIKDVLILREVENTANIDSTIEKTINEIEHMTIDIFNSKKNSISVGTFVNLREQFELENTVYAFLFRVEIYPTRY